MLHPTLPRSFPFDRFRIQLIDFVEPLCHSPVNNWIIQLFSPYPPHQPPLSEVSDFGGTVYTPYLPYS